ncbi:MAG: signal peptidase I [Lentisphaerae bacterium]|nr:signal peptidase I [Lentisphaerota bacterium]
MNFFQERKRKKQLSELKARRHAEDDLLSPALRVQFDRIISDLEQAPSAELPAALAQSSKEYSALPLPKRGKLYVLLDLIAVVGLVAFGLRGLFFQPFRIPTGSMQPTLFGVHHQSVENNANPGFGKLPGVLQNIVYGCADAEAVHSGVSGGVSSNLRQVSGKVFDCTEFMIGTTRYVLPGNPRQVIDYSQLTKQETFADGDKISSGYVSLGDHLFVERVSMYISPLKRGDVIVFNTEDLFVDMIPLAQSGGYYYIKRLAALPGDTVKIVDNQLYVRPAGKAEFFKIQELDPRFEKIYSMKGGYHGHLSGMGTCGFASGEEFTVPEDNYLMLGDNSRFSMDSRFFGTVPRRNLIGRAWFVFYPFSRRLGPVDRNNVLNEPTGLPGESTFVPMSHQ